MTNGLGDLFIEIGNAIKKYENANADSKEKKKLLKLQEVIKEYPILTTYALNDAVRKGLLPVIKRGKLNFYDSEDIERYLSSLKCKNNTQTEIIDSKRNNSKVKFV